MYDWINWNWKGRHLENIWWYFSACLIKGGIKCRIASRRGGSSVLLIFLSLSVVRSEEKLTKLNWTPWKEFIWDAWIFTFFTVNRPSKIKCLRSSLLPIKLLWHIMTATDWTLFPFSTFNIILKNTLEIDAEYLHICTYLPRSILKSRCISTI